MVQVEPVSCQKLVLESGCVGTRKIYHSQRADGFALLYWRGESERQTVNTASCGTIGTFAYFAERLLYICVFSMRKVLFSKFHCLLRIAKQITQQTVDFGFER